MSAASRAREAARIKAGGVDGRAHYKQPAVLMATRFRHKDGSPIRRGEMRAAELRLMEEKRQRENARRVASVATLFPTAGEKAP